MLGWLSNMWALHWGCLVGILGLTGAMLLMGYERRLHALEQRRDRRIREEFEAYARLDAGLHGGDVHQLAKRVCRLVAGKSAFQRVAMMARDATGRIHVASSVGMEEMTVRALQSWAERVKDETAEERATSDPDGIRVGEKSFAVVLGKDSADAGCGRAIIVPIQASTGELLGALAVCADRVMSLRRQTVEETLPPLEALAVKLGRVIEDAEVVERLKQAEKLARYGLLATGVARSMNNPLTCVLQFAERMAQTAKEARLRAAAETIVHEARRVQQTVQDLVDFERYGTRLEESVEIAGLVRELASECEEKLEARGVLLVVDAEDDVSAVRGNGDLLRLVFEHLLNNAAQAISRSGDDREREIRISMHHGEGSVQIIVSDTGPGFKQPGAVV